MGKGACVVTNPRLAVTTDAGRYYPRHGLQYMSVTTALGVLPKDALKQWAANVAADKAIEIANRSPSRVLGRLDRDEARYAWKDELAAAGALGDAVHSCCEFLVQNQDICFDAYLADIDDRKIRNRVKQFVKFLTDYEVKPVYVEATVYHDKHHYAGSCDLMAYVDGVLTVIDYKTSKGVYGSVALQMSAYANATVLIDDWDNECDVPAFERSAVLHLKDRSYKLIECELSARVFGCFLTALTLKRQFVDDISEVALLGIIAPTENKEIA